MASAAIAIAKAYAVALAYIAAVACVVTAPGLLLTGASGAVAAADAEVTAYTAAVAYVVAEKGGLWPPLFRMLGRVCCQKVRECVFISTMYDMNEALIVMSACRLVFAASRCRRPVVFGP